MTWYVVYRGKKPGVYEARASCSEQVAGFKKNNNRSFPSKEKVVASYLEYMGCEDIGMNDKVFVNKSTYSVVAIPRPDEKLADWRNLLIVALVLLVVAWFR
jgi:viroplasmin and RNaseH domain-containing protein